MSAAPLVRNHLRTAAVTVPLVASSSRLTLHHPCPLFFYRHSSTLPTRAEHAVAKPTVRISDQRLGTVPPSLFAGLGNGERGAELGLGAAGSINAAAAAAASGKLAVGPEVSKAVPSPVPPRRREIRAKKAALSMTPEAVARLRALMSSPTEPKLLRIGVKTRGCAGMAYHLDYVDPPGGRFDEVVEQDGVRVLIDSKALFSIIGSKMDWRDNRLSAGFVFENPNVVDTCGCGESFNIRL